MRFEKWQALGNDYLILESEQFPFELTPARVRKLCEGHFGVFADGVLLLCKSAAPDYLAELRIFNPDGSEAELSGNGAREAILYLRRRGWTEKDEFQILTAAGPIRPTITGEYTCRVDMGHAALASKDFPAGTPDGAAELRLPAGVVQIQHVSIGNPQCAIALGSVQELEALDLPAIGPPLEGHPEFPNRTNVSWFVELESGDDLAATPARIRARIFERGVGETLSSGTGATGAAVAYLLAGPGGREPGPPRDPVRVIVVLDGGELEVEVDSELHVHLSGWALPVFAGELSEPFVEQLRKSA